MEGYQGKPGYRNTQVVTMPKWAIAPIGDYSQMRAAALWCILKKCTFNSLPEALAGAVEMNIDGISIGVPYQEQAICIFQTNEAQVIELHGEESDRLPILEGNGMAKALGAIAIILEGKPFWLMAALAQCPEDWESIQAMSKCKALMD
jgi:hypothetical protein